MERRIAIIGPGRVGQSIATQAQRAGYQVTMGARRPSGKEVTLSDAARSAHLVLITVSDQCIASVATQIAPSLRSLSVVAHCSGFLPSSILLPAKEAGCLIASAHPLQSFPDPTRAGERLPGTFWFWEGDAEAEPPLSALVKALGGSLQRIDPETKPLYHAAAVFANNYVAILMDIALKLALECGIPAKTAGNAFRHLACCALDSTSDTGTVRLTGPVARGDSQVIVEHLRALKKWPEIWDLYRCLGSEALQRVKAALPENAIAELNEIFRGALGTEIRKQIR